MKTTTLLSEGANYTAINIGNLDGLSEYLYKHPKLNREIQGKLFTGEKLKTTSLEMSFMSMPAHSEMPFIHRHNLHEEVYLFLKGSGEFRVDDDSFDVTEGSIIRIAPQAKRIWRNNSEQPLIFICIQAVAGSLQQHYGNDGSLVKEEISWNN